MYFLIDSVWSLDGRVRKQPWTGRFVGLGSSRCLRWCWGRRSGGRGRRSCLTTSWPRWTHSPPYSGWTSSPGSATYSRLAISDSAFLFSRTVRRFIQFKVFLSGFISFNYLWFLPPPPRTHFFLNGNTFKS